MRQHSLPVGKLDAHSLEQLVFKHLGFRDPRVIVGPSLGEDASIVDFGDRVLVIHTDPITGSVENIGTLAVNVCTNDIATRGVRPLWILTVILLPRKMGSDQLQGITSQVDKAANELGVAVVGGHCEVTPGLDRPILITTALGETSRKKYVRTGGAEVGDNVIVTKGVAIEGTAILAHELESTLRRKLSKGIIDRAKGFIEKTSVLKEALLAIEAGGVDSMHDATEGGVAGCLQEIAWASNVGIVAYEKKMPIHEETTTICKALDIDPLRTISSGTLLIVVRRERTDSLLAALKKANVKAASVGRVVEKDKGLYILKNDGTRFDLKKQVNEELWRVLKR